MSLVYLDSKVKSIYVWYNHYMTYNIHPIFVHIPIAFLAVYSIVTIIPFHKFLPRIMWRDVRLIILIAGVIGAFFALGTGELAEHLVKPNHNIVETHALFASLSTWLYAILLLGEISAWYNRVFPEKKFMKSLSLWVTYILYNFIPVLCYQS